MPDECELDRNLDSMIDSALRNYAEPDAGFEARVLTRIAEARADEKTPARRQWLSWAIALPLAACVLLVVVLTLLHTAPKNEPTRQAWNHAAPQRQTTRTAPEIAAQTPKILARRNELHPVVTRGVRAATQRSTQQAAAKTVPLPKLDVFPAPRPLTAEEQALAHFVATAPPAERETLLAEQKQRNAPISIAAIEIKPLEPPNKTGN